jgi:hypothetical protein
MGRTYEELDDRLRAWIARQPLFFVGTAPLAGDGHVNVSPKGPTGTLRVLGPRRVAYLDLMGSGAETIAHLRENGRIVVMLCAFDGPPRILRLHGRGTALFPEDPGYAELLSEAAFEETTVPEGRRAIVVVDVERIGDSCGYGVPLMTYDRERPHMAASKAKRLRVGGPQAFTAYKAENNAVSLDGLPAVPLT